MVSDPVQITLHEATRALGTHFADRYAGWYYKIDSETIFLSTTQVFRRIWCTNCGPAHTNIIGPFDTKNAAVLDSEKHKPK